MTLHVSVTIGGLQVSVEDDDTAPLPEVVETFARIAGQQAVATYNELPDVMTVEVEGEQP